MEEMAVKSGRPLESMQLDEMEMYWEEAKKDEK